MNGISLFSGTAIGELVFRHIIPGYRTVGYVEWDKYCQKVIRQRIRDGWLDDAPVYGDIREFNERYASLYAGKVDWLSAGFPCQPFSVAGRQLGEADERNMWPATRDAIRILRPRYFLGENVPGLASHRYIYRVIADLAEIGYDAEWDIVGASDVGANHRRKRWWVLANSASVRYGEGRGQQNIHETNGRSDGSRGSISASTSQRSENMADAERGGCRTQGVTTSMVGMGKQQTDNSIQASQRSPDVADTQCNRLQGEPHRRCSESPQVDDSRCKTSRTSHEILDPDSASSTRHGEYGGEGSVRRPEVLADPGESRLEGAKQHGTCNEGSWTQGTTTERTEGGGDWWTVEPDVGRVANGVAHRVDRLKATGNGWVPQVVAAILNIERERP